MKEREQFKSRIGFILLSAGCAIGIGNVWRFPYVVGENGGGIFVLFYLIFLLLIGVPILSMEFSVGRASKKSPVKSFKVLEKTNQKWHLHGYMSLLGNICLMIFYTTVSGWMLKYFYNFLTGQFNGLSTADVQNVFSQVLASPSTNVFWMIVVVALGMFICSKGLQNGVERITKVMMIGLLGLIVVLAIHGVLLDGGMVGVKFYLYPDFQKISEIGLMNVIVSAMNQAFFTLSIGIGSMAIFGSYLNKEQTLLKEATNVAVLDTFVAIMAGLIIFPACFSFGINPDSGPSLIFITLPNVFVSMAGGQIWGALFFLFMSFASLSTVIAVFENIIACTMELLNIERKKAVVINFIVISILSLPCALGFNVLSGIQPLGTGSTILDLEDLIVSQFLLPLGSLVYLLFCTSKYGWGFENYQKEANIGKGLKVPHWVKFYVTIILPIIVIFVFINGII
ncbi:sodium-dependent transporter [Faecalibacillus intestinalis]|jgi:neurotransmitter:Na+ symporter, NSS family|uniref:sodium-dependent transporter n=1 Tax=Faecalibacillus intestinalis TaxID=1982626 RepID=UPI000E4242F3|nr:sodium-dependent transporter [Faecalibacillus intestinalis]RGF24390.1 sodium-dependent transporter [Coprobacillus sp. AM09-26]